MEKETYKTARELLEKYDPSNPSLHATPSRPPARRASNQNGGGEVRRRRQPQTPHPAFMPQNIAMATPQVPRPAVANTATPATTASNQPPQTEGAPPNQPAQATGAPNQPPQMSGAPPTVPATPQPSLQHIPPG